MPRIGYLVAAIVGVVTAFAFGTIAGAGAQDSQEPFWSCRGSVARVSFPPNTFPDIEPVNANPNQSPCSDDEGGFPTIALPPPPAAPAITANVVFARTDVLCAGDDANPDVTPDNNDDCDAGRHSFEQQVVSRAGVADLEVKLGSGEQSLDVKAAVASSRTNASCVGGKPSLNSASTVVTAVINGNEITVPQNEPTTIDLQQLGKVIFNERVGTEGVHTADSGSLTRRAVHVILGSGDNSIHAVVGETIADYHGDVCTRTVSGPPSCPPGSTPNAQGQCIITSTECPPGAVKNPQGQCVIAQAQCPNGTQFDPSTLSCIESPKGGRLVPLSQVPGHAGSPCRDPRFGRDIAIIGTKGADRITGTNRPDRIFPLAGNDRVSGGRGNDCIEGDSGRDVLDGSNGNDYLLGGSGRDSVTGGPGRDRMWGGSGRDKLSGGVGNDVIRGSGGNDKIQGDFGNDRLYGGSGNDGIHTGNGKDVVFGGPGNDVINAGTRGPAAFVDCGPGRDRVRINNNERNRTRNCEFVDVFHRIRSGK